MARNRKSRTNVWLITGITTFIALVVVGLLILGNRTPQADAEHLELISDLPRGISLAGNPFLGAEDAPVVMLLYEDLGCPNCRNFYRDVEPEIITEFVESGQVRIEIYPLAFVNASSLPAAEGAACALEQDAFWEYREVVFANQGVRSFNRQNLVDMAEEIGLDRTLFADCFDQARYAQEIVERSQTAFEFGITGTPTSEVNGERHVGMIPFEYEDASADGMKQILENALAEVSQ